MIKPESLIILAQPSRPVEPTAGALDNGSVFEQKEFSGLLRR
jgi:hypothetical protein